MGGLVTLLAGIAFGIGLAVSGAADPRMILGFLDVTGDFRPQLAGVICAALAVNLVVWPLVLRRKAPLLSEKFSVPTRTDLDRPLILGSLLFGLGWGAGGYCAGPALTALFASTQSASLYLASLTAGYLLYAFVTEPRKAS
jgi:uncharacterized protein